LENYKDIEKFKHKVFHSKIREGGGAGVVEVGKLLELDGNIKCTR
jgi:hypothetical protein